jgi:6-phosphogluconolactonase
MAEVGMMSSRVHFHNFNTKVDLVEALSQNIAKNLQDAIDKKGRATLIVSGGNTPKLLFEKLRKIKLEWEKVTVGLCDERWVSPSNEDSNEKFVKTYLLQDEAREATFVGMYITGMSVEKAEPICAKNFKEHLLPFDVLILGMGSDAHTASLFPNNPKLEQGLDLDNKEICIVVEPNCAPYIRISLTLSAILNAEHIYLHFEGDNKLAVYEEAMGGDNVHKMPIRSILHQDKKDIEVYYT